MHTSATMLILSFWDYVSRKARLKAREVLKGMIK